MEIMTTKNKQTKETLMPLGWSVKKIKDISPLQRGFDLTSSELIKGKYPVVYSNGIGFYHSEYMIIGPGVIMGRSGTLGKIHYLSDNFWPHNTTLWVTNFFNNNPKFIYYLLQFIGTERFGSGSGVPTLNRNDVHDYKISIPLNNKEQKAIAQVLSDTDSLIQALEKKIAKKKLIKKGMMQKLLTSKAGWEMKTIKDVADCLDHTRIPLNEAQRAKMKGDIPYCGANGIVDYVNDFTIDDDVILIAEDGGYFDEYEDRPIAYRIMGKCWVNNHAHVLKAKRLFSQGFLFHSLVHKNILGYINGGTRAKLNKAEMFKIEIHIPISKDEQNRIATILDDLEDEITVLKQKLSKYQLAKQGMMQQLLTGKIRLV